MMMMMMTLSWGLDDYEDDDVDDDNVSPNMYIVSVFINWNQFHFKWNKEEVHNW